MTTWKFNFPGRFSVDMDYSIRISADAFNASNQFRNRQEKERKKILSVESTDILREVDNHSCYNLNYPAIL